MPKFMKISSALARAVEDERAPATMRVKALEQIQRPTLKHASPSTGPLEEQSRQAAIKAPGPCGTQVCRC